MPNPLPEKRVGPALLLIGGFSLLVYIMYVLIKREADAATCLFIAALLLIGWFLHRHFGRWGLPPKPSAPKPAAPPPPAAKPAPAKGGLSLPFGKKKPPPPPPPPKPPPPPPPPKPKGLIGALDEFFRPKKK